MYNDLYSLNLRHLIVGVDTKVPLANGQAEVYVNFDNAATTPPFISVMNKINKFAPWYSSIHRGTGYKSTISTKLYDICREVVAHFVNASLGENDVIFVKNTTEAINKLSYLLCGDKNKNIVLCSGMEHHSNDLPWRNKFNVIYIDTDEFGRLSMKDLEEKLIEFQGKVKLVTITGASNVTGYVNPIYDIAYLAHKYDSKILVDGAQLIPHVSLDVKPNNSNEHIDFLAFSGHKMYAPFGCGVLMGPKEVFTNNISEQVGGGTVKIVTPKQVVWASSPENQEAGTPNLIGAVALGAAIDTLSSIGMSKIDRYENCLKNYALKRLVSIKDIELYCKINDWEPRVGIIPFNIKGVPHEATARILSEQWGIAVRNGCFCAHPYVEKLLNVPTEEIQQMIENPDKTKKGMVRASFGLYNTYSEIDTFIRALNTIVKNKNMYL